VAQHLPFAVVANEIIIQAYVRNTVPGQKEGKRVQCIQLLPSAAVRPHTSTRLINIRQALLHPQTKQTRTDVF